MEIFSLEFFLVLVFGALGGLTKSLIYLQNEISKNNKIGLQKFFVMLFIDILIGAGASFGVWGIGKAMGGNIGQYVIAYIAGLAGLTALDMITKSQGYKNERDLFVQSLVDENEIIEPLRNELELKTLQIEALQKELVEAQAKINTVDETEQLKESLEELQSRLAEAEKRLDDKLYTENLGENKAGQEQINQTKQ